MRGRLFSSNRIIHHVRLRCYQRRGRPPFVLNPNDHLTDILLKRLRGVFGQNAEQQVALRECEIQIISSSSAIN